MLDVLCRDHRDTESAQAFFRRTLGSTGLIPTTVVSDHHQPDVPAVQEVCPDAQHVRTGLHRARGETTKPIERSHVFTRDRLRASRGVKTLATGQRFLEGFEALHALRRGHTRLTDLVPGFDPVTARGLARHEQRTLFTRFWPAFISVLTHSCHHGKG